MFRGNELATDLRLRWAVPAVVFSGAVCGLGFAPFSQPLVLWLTLVPALVVVERTRPARAACLGLLHGTLYAAVISAWLVPTVRDYFGRSLAFTVGFQLLFWLTTVGVYHAALFAALSFTRRSLPRSAWLFLVPLAWVAADLARASLGLRSPWARIGDAFWQAEGLRQLASLTGVYGITALVVLGNVVARESLRCLFFLRRGVRPAAAPLVATATVFALLLAAAVFYGDRRQVALTADEQSATGEALDVVVVQANLESSLRWKRTQTSRVLRGYANLTRKALRDRPRPHLVIWPEQALQTSPDDGQYGPPLRSFVDVLETPILLGAPRHAGNGTSARIYNTAFLIQPDAETLHYDKQRLLPFSETRPMGLGQPRGDLDAAQYAAGDRPGLFAWQGPTLGALICFEAVYPEMARTLARGGAQVLVNIANDSWFRGPGGQEQHLAQVVFRSIETGLPMVRASTTGITAIIGPDGSVRERIAPDHAGVLQARLVAHQRPPPPYLEAGDAFALACAWTMAAATAVSLHRRLRARRSSFAARPTPGERSPSAARLAEP